MAKAAEGRSAGRVVVGMDPHKRSVTIEVMAGDETVLGGGRFATTVEGYRAMRAYVAAWSERVWAIEGCAGIGGHVATRLLGDGEQVVDVPPKLSARARVFTTGQGRKTDATDAHCVALVGTRMAGLRPVVDDQQLAVLRVLVDRRRSLGEDHTRMIAQLHHLLLQLIPGGAKKDLSAAQAKTLLASVRPRDAAGKTRRLRTSHGMSNFRKSIEAATHASNETSDKVRATFADMIKNGYRVGGSGRLFGFEILSEAELETWDGAEYPAAVVREEEAEIIQELARRMLAGESLKALADDLNGRGVTTTRGGQWTSGNLGRVLGNPLLGGHLAYKGEIKRTLANTEPIMDQETFDAVQAKLGARKRGRRATGLWPLSGLARCGNPACPKRGTLAGFTRAGGKRAYICAVGNGGCGQSIKAEKTEAMVAEKVLARLTNVKTLADMRAADAYLDEQRAKLRQQLDDLDADLAETEARRAASPRSQTRRREQHDQNLATLQAQFEATERALAELGPVTAPTPPLPSMTLHQWEKASAAEQAAVIRRLGLRITIKPSERKQGSSRLPFEEERVEITRER